MTQEEKLERWLRLQELRKQIEALAEEYRTLSGDNVPDFNSVWGGAGPDD